MHRKSPGDMYLSYADAYVCDYMSTSVYLICLGTLTSVVISTRHTEFVYILMDCNVVCYDTYLLCIQ